MPRLPPINAIRPSAPIRIKYQKRLDTLIDEMQASIVAELSATYDENEPHALILYGQDASPAAMMTGAMKRLSRQWLKRFDELAPKMATHFATAVKDRCDKLLMADLRAGGMSVRFKLTAAMNDVLQSTISESVALIKSIPQQHLLGIESIVTRSVTAGRDLGALTTELRERYGVTKRRAANIALSQNNIATAMLTRARWLELGITEGIWLHSAGGKVPRPTHVAFSGQKYDVAKGVILDPKEGVVWPGTAISCRCSGKPALFD